MANANVPKTDDAKETRYPADATQAEKVAEELTEEGIITESRDNERYILSGGGNGGDGVEAYVQHMREEYEVGDEEKQEIIEKSEEPEFRERLSDEDKAVYDDQVSDILKDAQKAIDEDNEPIPLVRVKTDTETEEAFEQGVEAGGISTPLTMKTQKEALTMLRMIAEALADEGLQVGEGEKIKDLLAKVRKKYSKNADINAELNDIGRYLPIAQDALDQGKDVPKFEETPELRTETTAAKKAREEEIAQAPFASIEVPKNSPEKARAIIQQIKDYLDNIDYDEAKIDLPDEDEIALYKLLQDLQKAYPSDAVIEKGVGELFDKVRKARMDTGTHVTDVPDVPVERARRRIVENEFADVPTTKAAGVSGEFDSANSKAEDNGFREDDVVAELRTAMNFAEGKAVRPVEVEEPVPPTINDPEATEDKKVAPTIPYGPGETEVPESVPPTAPGTPVSEALKTAEPIPPTVDDWEDEEGPPTQRVPSIPASEAAPKTEEDEAMADTVEAPEPSTTVKVESGADTATETLDQATDRLLNDLENDIRYTVMLRLVKLLKARRSMMDEADKRTHAVALKRAFGTDDLGAIWGKVNDGDERLKNFMNGPVFVDNNSDTIDKWAVLKRLITNISGEKTLPAAHSVIEEMNNKLMALSGEFNAAQAPDTVQEPDQDADQAPPTLRSAGIDSQTTGAPDTQATSIPVVSAPPSAKPSTAPIGATAPVPSSSSAQTIPVTPNAPSTTVISQPAPSAAPPWTVRINNQAQEAKERADALHKLRDQFHRLADKLPEKEELNTRIDAIFDVLEDEPDPLSFSKEDYDYLNQVKESVDNLILKDIPAKISGMSPCTKMPEFLAAFQALDLRDQVKAMREIAKLILDDDLGEILGDYDRIVNGRPTPVPVSAPAPAPQVNAGPQLHVNEYFGNEITKRKYVNGFLHRMGFDKKNKAAEIQAIRTVLMSSLESRTQIKELEAFVNKGEFQDEVDALIMANTPDELKNKYRKTLGKMAGIDAKIAGLKKALTKKNQSDTAAIKKIGEDIGELEEEKETLNDEKQNLKLALERVKKQEDEDIEDYSRNPERLLSMINLFFAKKKAKKGEKPKLNEILDKTHEQIETARIDQRPRGTWICNRMLPWNYLKPMLKGTLANICAKDPALKKIDTEKAHALAKTWDNSDSVRSWIQSLEGTEKQNMETIVPKLIAHLNIVVGTGRVANINSISLNRARALMHKLRHEVHEYSIKQAERAPGKTMDRMGSYFKQMNEINDNAKAEESIVIGNSRAKMARNAAIGGGIGVGALQFATLGIPAMVGVGAAGLAGTTLGSSFRVKDPETKAMLRRTSARALVAGGLGGLALAATGPVGAALLGMGAFAGAFTPEIVKNRKEIGRGAIKGAPHASRAGLWTGKNLLLRPFGMLVAGAFFVPLLKKEWRQKFGWPI